MPTIPHHNPVTGREIWNLTWPQALMMLFQFFIGFTNVLVAGHIHANVQASLGIITQVHFALLVVGFAISNGGLAAMSQSLGAKLPLRAERYGGLMGMLALSLCIVIVLLGYTGRGYIFTWLQVPASLRELTDSLWVLHLWAVIPTYLSVQASAIFRANKNVMTPLCTGILVCSVNAITAVGLGLGFFGLPNLGATGLVLATIFSVTAGAIFNITLLWKKKYISKRTIAPWRWQKTAAPYLFKVALPSGGTQFLWQMGYLVLFSITASLPFGSVAAIAGLTAGMRMESFLFLPAIAFSSTGSVLVGHCLGAGDKKEAKRVGLKVAATGAIIMSVIAAIVFPFVPQVAALVAPDPDVQKEAISYMRYNLLSTPFTVTSMVMTGILTGAGASIFPLFTNGFSIWFIRLPLAWYLGLVLWQSSSGIFLAMLISQCVQASMHYFAFLRLDWTRFALTAKRFK